MTKELVSIIIPVYNVEKYLNRCVKSVVNQSYKNIEILLIDDGSQDNSPKLCDEWKEKDNRIKVIHKKNEGAGKARNTGIENANGKYICFFDSDDYIEPGTLEKGYNLIKKENSDIVMWGFKEEKNGEIQLEKIPNVEKTTYRNSEIQEFILPNLMCKDLDTGKETNLWMSLWVSMYSAKLIRENNWQIVSEREFFSEDMYSLLILYKNVKSVSIIKEACYVYCENQQSYTHQFKEDMYKNVKLFYTQCELKCDELNYSSKVHTSIIYPYFSHTITALKIITISELKKSEKKKKFNEIIEDKELIVALKKIVKKRVGLKWKILCYSIIYKLNWITHMLIKAKT